MKGFIKKTVLIVVSSLMLSGCTGTAAESEDAADFADITMDALFEANTVPSLLSNHKSVLIEYQSAGTDDARSSYIDADYLFISFDESSTVISKEEYWECDNPKTDPLLHYYWYAMDDEEDREMRYTPSDYALVAEEFTGREIIENIQDNGDGTRTITTKLNAEDTEEFMQAYDLEYPEGQDTAELRTEYVVDGNTLEIESMSSAVIADGKYSSASSVKITHDVDRPDELSDIEALIDEAKNSGKTGTRTIRIVYDYGTDAERSFEMEAGEGYKVALITRDGYDYLYADPEKNEEYTGGDGVSDATIYAFTEE